MKDEMTPRNIRKILRELKKGLVAIYGDQLQAAYLFGSYARGEGRAPDSDIDVIVVMHGDFNSKEVKNRSIDFIVSLCLKHDAVIACKFVSAKTYAESKMPFLITARRDAVAL
jgi:predicted nucleotidyltransferase